MSYSFELKAEAAMCLWEEVVTNRDDGRWSNYFDRVGTPTVRHSVMALVEPALQTWDALTEAERELLIPYDWEFIPAFLSAAVEWDPVYGPTVEDDPVAAMRQYLADLD